MAVLTALMSAADYAADGGDLDACDDLRPCFICPGFVDTHLHMPQLGIIASYSPQLLDWLDRFAFPAEQAFADSAFRGGAGAAFSRSSDCLRHNLRSGFYHGA
jgi:guanine deaminase